MNSLMSVRFPNQSKQPLPPSLTSKFAYAVHEQFFKHNSLHALRLMLLSYQDEDVSGNLNLLYVKKSSLSLQANGVLRTHPSDQSDEFHFCGDFGTKPFKHAHMGAAPTLQLALVPQKA